MLQTGLRAGQNGWGLGHDKTNRQCKTEVLQNKCGHLNPVASLRGGHWGHRQHNVGVALPPQQHSHCGHTPSLTAEPHRGRLCTSSTLDVALSEWCGTRPRMTAGWSGSPIGMETCPTSIENKCFLLSNLDVSYLVSAWHQNPQGFSSGLMPSFCG